VAYADFAALAALGSSAAIACLSSWNNCWEAGVSIFAILKVGATFSPINSSTKADKLAYVIGNCRGTAILTTGKLMPVVAVAPGTDFAAHGDRDGS
jgi:acyl-CoA synthetase (AMP-forming)/AMP-acid ligase II